MDNQASYFRLDRERRPKYTDTPSESWETLPEPDKPELPYRPGLRLSIRRHNPIPPFIRPLYSADPPKRLEHEIEYWRLMTQSEWCLLNPPTASPPHPDPTVTGLQIIDEIACKDGHGAQLVRCHLDEDPGRILVAKIYDAFYYQPWYEKPCDFTMCADRDYSFEAGAYEVLRDAKLDGKLCPKYYGSWTFDLPVPEALQLRAKPPFDPTRPVRMVLYEWIEGVSIDELLEDERTVKSIQPEIRLEVLAKSMEALCIMESLGVWHNDFGPQNVLVSPASGWTMSRLPAVFIIDFNLADITASPYWITNRQLPTPLPLSPRYRFFRETLPEFGIWVPNQYKDPIIYNGWLATRWDEDDERYTRLIAEEKKFFLAEDQYKFVPLGPESPPWSY